MCHTQISTEHAKMSKKESLLSNDLMSGKYMLECGCLCKMIDKRYNEGTHTHDMGQVGAREQ